MDLVRVGGWLQPSLNLIKLLHVRFLLSRIFARAIICSMEENAPTKRRPGRPKTKNPATERLPVVRVTPNNLNRYKAASESAGATFSAWVRDALDKAADSLEAGK